MRIAPERFEFIERGVAPRGDVMGGRDEQQVVRAEQPAEVGCDAPPQRFRRLHVGRADRGSNSEAGIVPQLHPAWVACSRRPGGWYPCCMGGGSSTSPTCASRPGSRASQPQVSNAGASARQPASGIAPWVGRMPYRPQKVAGTRTLPPVSVPSAKSTSPAATAEAEPDDELSGTRSVRTVPVVRMKSSCNHYVVTESFYTCADGQGICSERHGAGRCARGVRERRPPGATHGRRTPPARCRPLRRRHPVARWAAPRVRAQHRRAWRDPLGACAGARGG